MWERTITVGSAGKTFSATGWKLGWGVGPPDLINALQVLHHNCIYTCPTPIQVRHLIILFCHEHIFRALNKRGYLMII